MELRRAFFQLLEDTMTSCNTVVCNRPRPHAHFYFTVGIIYLTAACQGPSSQELSGQLHLSTLTPYIFGTVLLPTLVVHESYHTALSTHGTVQVIGLAFICTGDMP